MSQVLRQSTQVIVVIGPFVDVTDGFTPETGITLGAADEAEILKANTTTTTDISGATWAAITGCDGWYGLTLTTSHTDTIGPLTVMVNDDSVCLPVFARFQVIEEAAYDAMYASSADPKADINVATIDASAITATSIATGAITSAKFAAGAIDATAIADAAIDAATFAAGAITATVIATGAIDADALATDAVAEIADGVWDEDATGHQTQGTFGQAIGDPVADTNTIYKAVVTDATGATVGVDVVDLKTQIGTAGAGLTAIDLPDQTMNITGNITGNLSGSVGSVTGAVGSVTGNVGGNVTGSVGSVATGGIAAASFAAGAIDAAAIAANAIGASELAADAANEIADAILDRNVAGGSSTGRLVKEALYVLRNKTAIAAGSLTVYGTDDSTPAFTAAVTTTAGNPIDSIDPA